jgi:multimeric flavodoxin WrbA
MDDGFSMEGFNVQRPESSNPFANLEGMPVITVKAKMIGDRSMRVLGVCGSPRRHGNTQIMLEKVLQVCEEAGAETEFLFLRDYDIKPCDACETCGRHKKCHIKDDLHLILPKLWAADGIVIGSPVYGMGVSAHTRLLLDRIGGFHAAWMSGQDGKDGPGFTRTVGGAVLAAGRVGGSLAWSSLVAEFSLDQWIIGGAAFGYGWDRGEVLKDQAGMWEAAELGRRMVRTINLVNGGGWESDVRTETMTL